MFAEVTVNAAGDIVGGWCADTPPVDLRQPLYTKGAAADRLGDKPTERRVRLEITTTEWLEIDDRAKALAGEIARGFIEQGQVEQATAELTSWKRYRLTVLMRDGRIDLSGTGCDVPAVACCPGVEYRRLTLKPRPQAPTMVGRDA